MGIGDPKYFRLNQARLRGARFRYIAPECDLCKALNSVEHAIFECPQWDSERRKYLPQWMLRVEKRDEAIRQLYNGGCPRKYVHQFRKLLDKIDLVW